MLSTAFHDWGGGADDPDPSLTRSMATLSSPDLLYIIHGNCYFSQDVGDTSFPLWVISADWYNTLFAKESLYKYFYYP